MTGAAGPAIGAPVIRAEGLTRHYRLPRESLFRPGAVSHALNGVDLLVRPGESLGIVGESGCGKSTLARLVMAIDRPTAGRVEVLGKDLQALDPAALRAHRRQFQMVFQDPYGSLDPRQKVRRIVAEPLDAVPGEERRGAAREKTVAEVLEAVGLRRTDMDKYPHEFSGGQRQRIAIARALVTRPALIVADEPVSALDVSVQAQVLNLLLDLQAEFGLTYLLISHDLAVVDYVCPKVAVMYLGRVVEYAAAADIFGRPAHPYTQARLAAVPRRAPRPVSGPRRRRAVLQGGAGGAMAMARG
ncbi:MAG: ATP-binding cassette domain-containing protein, partial [Sneathiellaceae bacterium]